MNKYELVIVLDGKTTVAKKKSEIAKIEKLVKVFRGKILKTDEWGVKELAYSIGKSTTGLFIIFDLELEPKAACDLPLKLKLEENILRYLFIRREEEKKTAKNKK